MINPRSVQQTYQLTKIVSALSLTLTVTGCNHDIHKSIEKSMKPNVVIIYADDVGYGDIGAYGSKMIPTPNIDKLSNTGLRMTQCYSTSGTCTPSRYSLLTGAYAFRNKRAQILNADDPLLIEPGSTTLPSMFQNNGYKTAIIGKWHLGLGQDEIDWNESIKPGPLEVGFDESFIMPATNDRVPTVFLEGHHVYGLNKDDDPLYISYKEKIGNLPTGESNPELLYYPADSQHSGTIVTNISRIGWQTGGLSAWWNDEEMAKIFTERAKIFIERNKDNPFFLFLSMHENHCPRIPNPAFIGKSNNGLRGDAVVELDWVVHEVVSKLNELKLRENTIIIFSSDNGPIFYDGYEDGSIINANGHPASGRFRGGKYTVFEGGVRIPFIINWPKVIEAGKVSDVMVSQVDLLASFAELIGAEVPENSAPDSHNLIDVFLGRSTKGREQVVYQGRAGSLFAIRKGDWKLIPSSPVRSSTPHRKHNKYPNPLSTPQVGTGNYLFNLKEDPGETTNLAEKYPAKVKELTELFKNVYETPEKLLESVISK